MVTTMGNRMAQLDPAQGYRWTVAEVAPREQLHRFEGLHPLLVQLLWNRQIRDADAVLTFVRGAEAPLHSPWHLSGIEDTVSRLLRARDAGESIAIYGDYDVDGITSTTILAECLGLLGARARPFLPRRHVEGYGLNSQAIAELHQDGVTLLLAVDCGISAHQEIERARELGVDVVVLDHHQVPSALPNALAIVNPHQPGCPYPFKDLCAAGLAYKLAQALLDTAGGDAAEADQWLDLVALGTVADVVPLLGENRVLVLRGLSALNPPRRPGIQALAIEAGLGFARITAQSIAFVLAPRLNAAGRLEDAEISRRLLSTDSPSEAAALAVQLEEVNRERQRQTDEALSQACDEILERPDLTRLLLVASPSYPSGVVGLVAARLVERFHRPALVAAIDQEIARGSARSIAGFDVAKALAACADLLVRHGGHARAAGFTLGASNLEALQNRLEAIATEVIRDEDLEPTLEIDAEISLHRYDDSLYQLVERLEPCGFGNPSPLFLARQLEVVSARTVGREPPGHLKLRLRAGNRVWDAIWFHHGDPCRELSRRVDVVFAVGLNAWNGTATTQLKIRDLRPSVPQS